MGTLTLPNSGPIYLDACGFIYSVEHIEPYRGLMEPMWRQAATGQLTIVTSELSVMDLWSSLYATATKCSSGTSKNCSIPPKCDWCQLHGLCGKMPPKYAPD